MGTTCASATPGRSPRDSPGRGALHNLERSLLLGEEEDALARREGVSNYVGNRLRLARAGRRLNDKVLALHDVHEGAVLRGVGVLDQVGCDLLDLGVVNLVVVGHALEAVVLSVLDTFEDRADERVSDVVLPVLGLQVLVHGEAAEGEMAEHQPALHLPATEPFDGLW